MRSRLQQSLIHCICQVIQNIFFKIRKKTNNGILSINSTEYDSASQHQLDITKTTVLSYIIYSGVKTLDLIDQSKIFKK